MNPSNHTDTPATIRVAHLPGPPPPGETGAATHAGGGTPAGPTPNPAAPCGPAPRLDWTPHHVVVTVSGGLASTVLAHWLHAQGCKLTLLSVGYGQRTWAGTRQATTTAQHLGVVEHHVDLSHVTQLVRDHTTSPTPTRSRAARCTPPEGMNLLLVLDLAVWLALSIDADAVAFARYTTPTNTHPHHPETLLHAHRQLTRTAHRGHLPAGFDIIAPFLHLSTADIITLGAQLTVAWDTTWSCTHNLGPHCGLCAGCTERIHAFATAGVPDPTTYLTTPCPGHTPASAPPGHSR